MKHAHYQNVPFLIKYWVQCVNVSADPDLENKTIVKKIGNRFIVTQQLATGYRFHRDGVVEIIPLENAV